MCVAGDQDLKKVQTGLKRCTNVLCDHLVCIGSSTCNQTGAKEHHMGVETVQSLLKILHKFDYKTGYYKHMHHFATPNPS